MVLMDLFKRITIILKIWIKEMKFLQTDVYEKIMDYWMVLILIIFYLHHQLINMLIWNTIMNIITFISMSPFQHQKNHQFQHWLYLTLHQEFMKGVHDFVKYSRRSSIHIYPKLNQDLLGVRLIYWNQRKNY